MKRYYIVGLFIPCKNLEKIRKGSKPALKEIEPFARSFWANDPEQALSMASDALDGGQWLETPKISLTSEEQRMRQSGAPELPGFAPSSASTGKKKGKSSQR
jgi:hypothetical protein